MLNIISNMLFIIAYICNTKMLSNKLKIAHILFLYNARNKNTKMNYF